MLVDIFHDTHAWLQVDPDISRTRADDSADRNVRPRLKFIDSGFPENGNRTRCDAMPAKPFTPLALLTAINECLAEARSGFASAVQLRQL